MAQALCVSSPDNAATYNVENNTAQSVCLQDELAFAARLRAEQAKVDAMLGNIQIQLNKQRLQMMQQQPMGQAAWPNY
jgi:hypothetical protein